MKNPIVSIITPCYNGAKVMHRLLDSIIAQTYKNIEFILVNDGSTDDSEVVWNSYIKKFYDAGIDVKYIYQENKGLGAAINAGLKVFTGDYLCWPDIDDYLDPTSVEKRVNFLESHLEYGSVSSDANIYKEDNLINPVGTAASWMKHKYDAWQFKWLVSGQSLFCSGCHMLRVSCFLDVNPDRYIYPARRGQNNQMLLPIYYKYKHGFIDEPLYNYVVYNNSMSSADITFEQVKDRSEEYFCILTWCFNQINMDVDTKKFCVQVRNINFWNNMSDALCEYGYPFKLLYYYFKLGIFKSNLKKEVVKIIIAFNKLIKIKMKRAYKT